MRYDELNEFYNVYENDDTVAERMFNRVMRNAMWELFEHQEDWIHMAGEKGKYPVMKDDAYKIVREHVIEALSFDICTLTDIILDQTYRGIVNPGKETRWYLEDIFGHDYPNWEDVYPEGIPYEEYEGEGKISGRAAYDFREEED